MHVTLGLVLGLLPLVAATLLWRRSRVTRDIPTLRAIGVATAGALLAWVCQFAEAALWDWTGLSLVAVAGKESEAMLAMFLFAAPLEEGAKVLCVWPPYRARRIRRARQGIALSAMAGAGFAAGKTSALLILGRHAELLPVLRAVLGIPPHVICAAIWGATLGARSKTGWFALAWGVATVLHGLFDHIVFGRGPGVMVLSAPLLLTMIAIAYAALRSATSGEAALGQGYRGSERPQSAPPWSEPPSLARVWHALEPKQQPLMLHWIGLGMLVTAGIGIAALAAGLYAGHALGLDFAAADEADVRSNGPLLFLATAVGSAFPLAGYLVARASGTPSVLEPALGAALAVLGGVLFLSVTTPIAAIFALALAPIAFLLASAGAWFGTDH